MPSAASVSMSAWMRSGRRPTTRNRAFGHAQRTARMWLSPWMPAPNTSTSGASGSSSPAGAAAASARRPVSVIAGVRTAVTSMPSMTHNGADVSLSNSRYVP
jgi:hypothetical protein